MKFLALISGGKDSFFNIHHCLSRGHELVALGNLYPAAKDGDEIDSFMFQTVGHEVIDYYGECLDVPIYRQEIKGKSKNQELEYKITEEDEIEDLFKLISTIKHHHPQVEGVSCGAILSHYQRNRVEDVCERLGLTPLAYLWQRSQPELMQEMILNGLDARLIKVAAIGLTSKDLGKSIADVYPYLLKLNLMYDVHVCGEGGEFETIVLDSPIFKRKKLQIVDSETITLSNDDVCYMKLKVELVDKEEVYKEVCAPKLLDGDFEKVLEELSELDHLSTDLPKLSLEDSMTEPISKLQFHSSVTETSTKIYVSNLVSDKGEEPEQMKEIFHQLSSYLDHYQLSTKNIQHMTLLLKDMSKFIQLNLIYFQFFEKFNLPPSRICIQTTLPNNYKIQLSCIINKPNGYQAEGIHIRSRSYWAPQNIGPYSQSKVDVQRYYKVASLSGQIPLLPWNMQLLDDSDEVNSILSLQHLHRVKQLINVKKLASVICFITRDNLVNLVQDIWQLYCDNELENWYNRLTVVKVESLPKNADVEWGGFSYETVEDNDDDDNESSDMEDSIELGAFELVNKVEVSDGLHLFNISSNDIERVSKLVKTAKKTCHFTILTDLQTIANLEIESKANIEYLPVLATWRDHQNYKISIIMKIESEFKN